MIECAISKNAELVIVSRDADYGATYGNKSYVNDHLRQEFSNRVSQKRELLRYSKVSDALKHFHVAVTPAQVKAEAELTEQIKISDKLLALETGADDYLVKPCDQVELVARVRAGIRVVGLTQSLRRTVADLRAGTQPQEPPIRWCESCHRLDEGTGWMDLPFFLRERLGRPVVADSCPDCGAKADAPPDDEKKAA